MSTASTLVTESGTSQARKAISNNYIKIVLLLFNLVFCCFFCGCKNPFAPAEDFSLNAESDLSENLKSIDGVFLQVQQAYAMKDTIRYGSAISSQFIFTYRDYDAGYDVSWERSEEMRITNGLFKNSEKLDLIWNNFITQTYSADSSQAAIIRSFNLTVTFNPFDVARLDGRVNLQLKREINTGKWEIIRWIDESNY